MIVSRASRRGVEVAGKLRLPIAIQMARKGRSLLFSVKGHTAGGFIREGVYRYVPWDGLARTGNPKDHFEDIFNNALVLIRRHCAEDCPRSNMHVRPVTSRSVSP